jgi:hypothetical protein
MFVSWKYIFRPHEAQWWVGSVFSIVGALFLLALPPLLTPEWPGEEVRATVVELEGDRAGMQRPVLRVGDEMREYRREVWSSRPMLAVGDQVLMVRDATGERWYVKDDPEMRLVIWVLRALGADLLLIGGIVLILTLLDLPTYLVHTVGGALGALSFGLPASMALPGLWLAHHARPNLLFRADDPLTTADLLLGAGFSVLGILVTLGTAVLARYQLRNRSLGWRGSRR